MELNSDTSPELQPKEENIAAYKRPFFKWDNTVNLANLLTLITIIAAFFGLYFQKKGVDVKVKDLQAVVQDLEEEKRIRELSNLRLTADKMNGDSYNLKYTTDQIKAIQKNNDQYFIEIFGQINKIIAVILQSNLFPRDNINDLRNASLTNMARREICAHYLIYEQKIEEFEEHNIPNRENYKTDDEYIQSYKLYNVALKRNTDYLLHKLDSLLQEPKNRIRILSKEAQ